MKKIVVLGTIFLVFSSFMVYNNDGFTNLVQIKLKTYSTEKWPEKVYIQTDKPYYSLGETIWFTTYLVNGITHKKSSKSAVVYIELIDEESQRLDKVIIIAQKETQEELREKEISKRYFFYSPTYKIDLETDTSFTKQFSVMNLFTQFPGLVMNGRGLLLLEEVESQNLSLTTES